MNRNCRDMAWSFPIARIFGTQLRIHVTFFLLIAGFGVWGFRAAGLEGALFAALFVIALFGCVVLHEFGHALAGRLFGIRTPDITLLPIGGLARLERMPRNPWHEFVIAIAGPAVNVAIASAIAVLLALKPEFGVMPGEFPPATVPEFIIYLFSANISLVIFNMIPAFPMDGGRVLRSLLATMLPHARATAFAAGLGQLLAIAGGFFAISSQEPRFIPLALIAIFIFFAAGRESSAAKLRAATEDVPVSAAVLRHFTTLKPGNTLGQATELLIGTTQSNFPVLDDRGVFVGVLTHGSIINGLRKHGREVPISLVMGPSPRPVLSTVCLDQALELMSASGAPFVAVVDVPNGPITGILTPQSTGEMLAVRSALSNRIS